MIQYSWPRAWVPSRARFFPASRAVSSSSRYTGATRVGGSIVEPWVAEIVLDQMDESKWRPIRAFLMRLRGQVNLVRLWDPANIVPRGTAAGINRDTWGNVGLGKFSDDTTFSDGTGFRDGSSFATTHAAHRRGESSLVLSGLVPSQSVSLMADDRLEVGGYMHAVLADTSSDSAGHARAEISPPLRTDIVSGSLVSFVYPTSPFVMASSFQGINIVPPIRSEVVTLSFTEFLP